MTSTYFRFHCLFAIYVKPVVASSLLSILLTSFNFLYSTQSSFLCPPSMQLNSDWWVFPLSCKTDVTLSLTTGSGTLCVSRCVYLCSVCLRDICQKVFRIVLAVVAFSWIHPGCPNKWWKEFILSCKTTRLGAWASVCLPIKVEFCSLLPSLCDQDLICHALHMSAVCLHVVCECVWMSVLHWWEWI